MLHQLYKSYLSVLLAIIFLFCVIFSPQDSYAQGNYKTTDKIGGSGTSTNQTGETDNSSTTLIIVGAAVIAGFLVYKLVLDKDKPIKESKKDTTSNDGSLLFKNINECIANSESDFEKYQQLPVKVYAEIQKPDILIPKGKLILGINYNF